ncbi:T9SS type A sorting domain-containing protein [Cyclobacterium plantarum]|uniref:T9SS type A sorting domain-containing protein n=1 Tax=Cyclobacterium plantarum TaxID=2716263 RepID=A0ABX0H7I8_9BACT|nr:T9SS type A sorting domain-containing protein [Cyclobacterium plantarum]NHE55925.1 T9SS type A sorting domain-containing protein [Cyclobacterium plantarum]
MISRLSLLTRAFFAPCFLLIQANVALASEDNPLKISVVSISASSSIGSSDPANVLDGNWNTSWTSSHPFPSNYFSNPAQNILLHRQLLADGTTMLQAATDGNLGSHTGSVPLVQGYASAAIHLNQAQNIYLIGLKLGGVKEKVDILLEQQSGELTTLTYGSYQNYANVRFEVNLENILSIRLQSPHPFFIFDIAAMEAPAQEYITIDLGSPQLISQVKSKHWSGHNSSQATQLLLGTAADSLEVVANLETNDPAAVLTSFDSPIVARYLRIAHRLVGRDYNKAAIFELEVFGEPVPEVDPPSPWDPDAGLYLPLSDRASVTASSSVNLNNNSPLSVLDGNPSTAWISTNPLPDAYVRNPEQNIFLGSSGYASNEAPMAKATDGLLGNSSPLIEPIAGEAWFRLDLASTPIYRLGLRLAAGFSLPVLIEVRSQEGETVRHTYEVYDQGHLRFPIDLKDAVAVKLSSGAAFSIQEIAAYAAPLSEYITLDLGEEKSVSWIRTRQWNGNGTALKTLLKAGKSLEDLHLIATLDPSKLEMLNVQPEEPILARYIRMEQQLADENYKKASIQEISILDEYGSFGPPPSPKPQSNSFGELFGLNTVWAWGTKKVPNLQGLNEGAQKFIRTASQARNYHNIHWDTSDPDHIPGYGGENPDVRLPWTQWIQEYSDWKNKGFTVDATYTFDRFKESDWDQPYTSGHDLGYAFATTFGPNHENLIRTVEVGNEPWSYSDSTYRLILEGMAKGLKTGDPELKVLPAALQAYQPESSNTGSIKHYMGTKLSEKAAAHLDGINLHLYSYFRNEADVRLAVHPEHPASEMRALFAGLRFRDKNMPGKEVHVTEWGWDASSANESAVNTEAVSPLSQAVYALRGLFWLSRMGVDRAHWFFYANVDTLPGNSPVNYERSGLTESIYYNFKEKRSFIAAEAMQNRMADLYFDDVIREDDQAHIYQLRDKEGALSHLLAWRPVSGDDSLAVTFSLPSENVAAQAWHLSGLDPNGEPAEVTYEQGKLMLPLSSKPLLIELAHSDKNNSLQANLRVRQLEEETLLTVSTNSPIGKSQLIGLSGDTRLERMNLVWEKKNDLEWQARLTTLPPGRYEVRALLDSRNHPTNRVSFVVPHKMILFPNPTTGRSRLRLAPGLSGVSHIQVVGMDGFLFDAFQVPEKVRSYEMDLSQLKNGSYILHLDNVNYQERQKFIKK